jgi:hypothetical protein
MKLGRWRGISVEVGEEKISRGHGKNIYSSLFIKLYLFKGETWNEPSLQ